MARVAVIAARDGVGDPIAGALRATPGVAACERVPHDPAQIDTLALSTFDVVVYAAAAGAGPAGSPDVETARAIFDRLASLPLKQVVIVSSAAVYTASHQNVGLLDETAFMREGRSAIADAWRKIEELGSLIGTRSGTAAPIRTVLRPAAVLDGADYFSRLLRSRIAVTYPGHDPTLQLLSPVDLAGAVASVVSARLEGVYNVAPAGAIPLVKALRQAGSMRLPLPRLIQNVVRRCCAPTRLTATTDQLQYIQFSWTVSGEKLHRATGFAPSRTSADAIAELTGRTRRAAEAPFDDFGMDPGYIRGYCSHLFRFLHDAYWRVEIDGIDRVPLKGRGVLVGMHRGFMPFDGVMALYALVGQRDRIPRFLIHPSLTRFPFLADFMAKLGGIMACQENGDYVLQHDELLGVFPEGIRGAFTMYKRAYTLGKFGRDEFVRMALRNRAPILPFVTVGSAEIYPILRRVDWGWFKRYTEWPFLPVTPAPFPLPSKWHTQFLPPLHIEREYPPEAADDPETVRRISVEVRQRMQAAIDEMLLRRRSIFRGSIFDAARPS
jgi:1-acyl-sn-glycerol-3-phosphate acyltransferase